MPEIKFVTTFVLTSPRAARPALAAITDAGHSLREGSGVRGINMTTMEHYETWETSMPVAEVELLAVETSGAMTSVGPMAEPEDLQ